MPKSKKVALYARVSTDGQSTENQLRELRAAIARHGWTIVAEYVDRGVSGAKGRKDRPRSTPCCTPSHGKSSTWSRLGR